MTKHQVPTTNGKLPPWSLVLGAWTLVMIQAGCSHLPRPWLTRPDLPSPRATIAAAEKRELASTPTAPALPGSDQQEADAHPAAVSAALGRGRALERSGHLEKADKAYRAALAEHPGNAALLHRLGIVADSQKKHSQAEEFFLKALQAQPRQAEFLGDLGYCYYLQGKLDQASNALGKAVAIDPSHPRHRNNLGLVLGLRRNYDGAFEQFRAAGSEADAFYNMAFVFAAQDLTVEAVGCFEEALSADPGHQPAQEALAAFRQFDQRPADERGQDHEVASGVRYVPYLENLEMPSAGEVQQASATATIPASRHAGRATRTLQLQSRGLLNRHLLSQRGENDR